MSELLEIAHAGKRITSVDPAGAVGALAASARAARPPRSRTPSGSRPAGTAR
jgi:hypothetical protein